MIAALMQLNASEAVAAELAQTQAPTAPVPVQGWSGDRAMADIAAQLHFAPRSIGTPGHEQTIDYIKSQLAKTSVKAVKAQSWTYTVPGGTAIKLTNIIASFDPENPRRIIVGTHYDSLARAYRDAERPNEPMPGANNSASGVAERFARSSFRRRFDLLRWRGGASGAWRGRSELDRPWLSVFCSASR
jgi:glutaminyl-peptide cyclotransferase